MARLDRKELLHDEFVEETMSLVHRIEDNPRPFVIGAIVIVAGVGLGIAVQKFVRSGHEHSADLLAQAQAAMVAPLAGTDPAKPSDHYRPSFATTAERTKETLARLDQATQGSGTSAKLSSFLRGATLLEAGDGAGAVTALLKADQELGADPTVGPSIRAALAEAYSAAGQHDKALDLFTKLTADTSGWYPRDQLLAGKARAQTRAGKGDDARGTWQQLLDLFPNSPYSDEAKKAVGG